MPLIGAYNQTVKRAIVVAAMLICTLASAADKSNKSAEDRLKTINVSALDAQGAPVAGLQSGDFQLTEDGKPQNIAFFRFTGDKPMPSTRLGPHEYSNRTNAPTHATVILIDLLNDRLMSGAIMGDESSRYLKGLESAEGLYLYILTAEGALYPVHPLPKPDTEITSTSEPWTRNIGPMLDAAIKHVFAFKPVDDRDIKVRYDVTMKALLELGGQMQEVSDRRNLIWVSHGVPLNGNSISEQGHIDLTNPVRQICERLEQAQIVVYPVEQSVEGAAQAIGTEGEMTLDEFSGLTGGRQYRSGSVGDAVQAAMTDSRANYQISYYTSALKTDGKHHKIKVTCSHKDVRLQTEQGFYSMLGAAPKTDVEHAAFANAAHSPFDATAIGLRASIAPDPANSKNTQFAVHIDPADLFLRQTQDRHTGKLTVVFAAYEGTKLDQPAAPFRLDINFSPDQYQKAMQGGIELKPAVPIGPAVQKVRVIVLDSGLEAVGSVTIPIQH
jgi:VWFA-related protein